MKKYNYITKILEKIEKMSNGKTAYSYESGNVSRSTTWQEISISDYELYVSERFKKLCNAWRVAGLQIGLKIIFVYNADCSQERLVKLLNEDNLILFIQE